MVEANGNGSKSAAADPENQDSSLLNKQNSELLDDNKLIDDEEARQNEELKKLNQELELGESKSIINFHSI